jgi:hypothetical protein
MVRKAPTRGSRVVDGDQAAVPRQDAGALGRRIVAVILGLQRAAGNRAVSHWLASDRQHRMPGAGVGRRGSASPAGSRRHGGPVRYDLGGVRVHAQPSVRCWRTARPGRAERLARATGRIAVASAAPADLAGGPRWPSSTSMETCSASCAGFYPRKQRA